MIILKMFQRRITLFNQTLLILDINECADSPCNRGTCINKPGFFYCECPEGMVLDESERNCIDLDECSTPGYCQYGTCTNKLDGKGFDCQCNAGFMKTMDGKSCEGMVFHI